MALFGQSKTVLATEKERKIKTDAASPALHQSEHYGKETFFNQGSILLIEQYYIAVAAEALMGRIL